MIDPKFSPMLPGLNFMRYEREEEAGKRMKKEGVV